MKKIIIFFIFLLLFTSLFSEPNAEIKDLKPLDQIKGTLFFPLFVGAKWEWHVKGMGNFSKVVWEIISAHIINDTINNVNNSIAFKLKATFIFDEKEMTDEWYILEHEGYICFYKKSRNDFYIEKIMPINPSINDSWMNASNKFEISEITNSKIKIELKNEELGRFGYQVFSRDIGPYEIYEYLIIDDNKQQMLMSLINNVSYKDISSIKNKEFAALKEKKIEETTIEEDTLVNTPEKDDDFDITEDDFISSLSKDKKYFQVGSFRMDSYAKELTLKAKKAGLVPKIFLDKDEQYKVLIEFSKEKSIIEKEIKEKLGITPFLKK